MSDISDKMEEVAVHFWGKPTSKTSKELRWGNHGSKSVNLSQGTWYDFENEEGGGVVDLVKKEMPSLNGSIQGFLDTFTDTPQPKSKKSTIYDYKNLEGQTIYQVVRYEPKSFRQRRMQDGQTVWNLQGVTPLPFRLNYIKDKPLVFIVEGEKDVLHLEKLGLAATCNSGGSGKWTEAHSQYFKDKDIVILPDNDEPGLKHARQVQISLQNIAKSVKTIELPGLKPKEDSYDWLQKHSVQELMQLVQDTETKTDITPIDVLSMAQVIDMPPTPWLIKDYMPQGSMSMIYGPPGSGKTFLALDMALHIAHGISWHGKDVEQGSVMYIAGEGVGGLRKRLQAWHINKNLKPTAPLHIIPVAVGLLDDQEIDNLITTIQILAKDIKMVVFDTVARCMTGDENSAQDMGQAIKAMDRIKHQCNCCVVPIHHSGKDRDRGARGSTAMIGAVDVSLRVDRQEKQLSLTTEKQKDAEAEDITLFNSNSIELPNQGLDLGDIESSLVLELADIPGQKIRKMTPAQKNVYEALQQAINECGTREGSERIPGKCVTIDMWKLYSYNTTISTSDSEDAKRKAFTRAAKSLKNAGFVDVWRKFAWTKGQNADGQVVQAVNSRKPGVVD